ncbi:MAG: 2-amino-4-hydroxy-6-hydroxymethyldihydropteridine diphosphokinase [Blastocatellia bacterium]|nr:2-amino-4-hydroxy-6-hydroxymethyldihydropteridine diphosphokinase [Blastocatellia bacterium]MCS7157415.1 2-amino-4-hydroxy-6-hydroxymethyldihydropteridine diphosphokinase [Blastocatellia bacterium]MCX7752589.1 2-amino-4-hydroxy-6-hydroxymethyldihydropteridine diphosphokinase [Blastocatellia bacterium]MDW8168320.1 2-amino-4-hydroxy-6-hydroxymethyldihydropteridine diphosphokinase [Acidobacteriota bacterium]MDW8255516.1 2-amino-4-hydroxy-6-hydroxymethyldihydropteridine diphosphokinase [Acidobac
MREHIAFIGLGSNLGDREAYLAGARRALSHYGILERCSSLYETEPVDVRDQPRFLNQVIALRTPLDPIALLRACQAIERALGRERLIPKGPRTIDLDLLLYEDRVLTLQTEDVQLILPHPRLHQRRFVLVPLCEIYPDGCHPVLGKPFSQLLAELTDTAEVTLYAKVFA